MAGESILIVEDEAVIALDLREKLEELGYEVIGRADNGEKAVLLARDRRPDLILMDISIKGPIDGIDTAAVIRRDLKIPVVFMTSFSDSETVRRAALTAPYGYLTKPYKVKDLRAGIKVALQKAALEDQLQDSDRWFASTLRCTTDGVVATNESGVVDFLNPTAEKLTGWQLEDARGRPVEEVIRFGDSGTGASGTAAGQVTEIERSRRLLRRDGGESLIDDTAAPLLDEDGNCIGRVVVLRDASGRRTHEQRLRASEAQFRDEHNASPVGVALVSLSGSYLQINDAFARLLGRPMQELLKERDQELTHPDDRTMEKERLFELVIEIEPAVKFNKRYLGKDGRALPVSVQATLKYEDGEPVCYVCEISGRGVGGS